jgi:hypothetical protein
MIPSPTSASRGVQHDSGEREPTRQPLRILEREADRVIVVTEVAEARKWFDGQREVAGDAQNVLEKLGNPRPDRSRVAAKDDDEKRDEDAPERPQRPGDEPEHEGHGDHRELRECFAASILGAALQDSDHRRRSRRRLVGHRRSQSRRLDAVRAELRLLKLLARPTSFEIR